MATGASLLALTCLTHAPNNSHKLCTSTQSTTFASISALTTGFPAIPTIIKRESTHVHCWNVGIMRQKAGELMSSSEKASERGESPPYRRRNGMNALEDSSRNIFMLTNSNSGDLVARGTPYPMRYPTWTPEHINELEITYDTNGKPDLGGVNTPLYDAIHFFDARDPNLAPPWNCHISDRCVAEIYLLVADGKESLDSLGKKWPHVFDTKEAV